MLIYRITETSRAGIAMASLSVVPFYGRMKSVQAR
jgi:hypothetical protein